MFGEPRERGVCVCVWGGGGGGGFTAKTRELMTLYVDFLKNFLRCLVTLNHSQMPSIVHS